MATSPRASRAASVSSIGTNGSGSLSLLPRYTPKPEPAYISAASAADHVTHRHSHDQFDLLSPATSSPTNDGAIFSEAALNLLNTFLDSLLYNFLAKACGTSLTQLRPAITEVLKAKLARDALASADEELGGFEDDEDYEDDENAETNDQWSQDWHLEMAFKRMRLRVMVFIRLGDFDDEDEDRFLEDEDDFRNNADKPTQEMSFLVNSPAAVYLAGILEHVAEQALTTAGEYAYRRSMSRVNRRSSVSNPKGLEGMDLERVTVAETDIEKLAMNPTLGRLWRTWRKNYRNTFGPGGARFSPPASPLPNRGCLGSLNEIAFPPNRFEFTPNRFDQDSRRALEEDRRLTPDEIPEGDVTETDIAANIPLPIGDNDIDEIEFLGDAVPLPMSENDADGIEMMGVAVPLPMSDNDVNEIEVPGLARKINDDEEELDEAVTPPAEPLKRRNSAILGQSLKNVPRPPLTRLRSNSTPVIGRLYYFLTPKAGAGEEQQPITTDDSEITQLEDAEDLSQPDAKDIVPEPAIGAFPETPAVEEFKDIVPEPAIGAFPETPAVEETKTFDKKTISPLIEDEEEKDTSVGVERPLTILDDEKMPVETSTMPAFMQKTEASAVDQEDPEHARGDGKENHTNETGIVAGVVAGAAALAGAAFATIAGSKNKNEEIEEDQMAMAAASKPMPEQSMSVSPIVSPGAPSVAGSAISESDKAPIAFSKRLTSYAPTGPIPRSNPDDYPESAQSEKLVAATATQNNRNGVAPFSQTKVEPAASTSSLGSGNDLGTVPASALDLEKPVKHKTMPSPPPAVAARGDDESKQNPSSGSDRDIEEIGVARTTNERVQPLTSSPRATTPEQRSYYLPGSPKSGPITSLPGSASKDRPSSGTEEHILARQTSMSKRNTGPSPLRSVTEADTRARDQNERFARDTPHAVPFYHNKSTNDEALKQEQLHKRLTKESGFPEAREGSISKSRPSPSTTALMSTAEATRPSTAQSTGRRSTSSTPTSGHSAKRSSSSSYKRPSDESRRKDFDSLLEEGETVKYTLTPDGLRESDPFRLSSSNPNRASALALSTAAIDRGPASPRIISTPSSGRRTPSAHDMAAAAPLKPEPATKATVISQPTIQPPPMKKGYIPRVSEFRRSLTPLSLASRPEPMNTNTRKSGFLPREPRVMTDDTRDFADFMRSTKPTTEPVLVPLVRSPSDSKLLNKVQPLRAFSRQKLVAREPDVKGGESADLIDFIREGPPSVHSTGEHRIPRTTAPFRSTADSDHLNALGSSVQTGTTPAAAPTSALSQNGQTGLQSSGSGMPPIARKTRRVKDPYAIDSDDEDDYLTSLPSSRPPQQEEESLADFLRNTEPPRAPAQAPVVSRSQGNVKSNAGGPVRSSSTTNSAAPSRLSKMKFQARPAGATKSGFGGKGFHYSTNDMADFLRSSGPVEAYAVAPEVPLTKKPSKRGFSRGRG
ncbi:60S ribosomal protein [Venturia nashicola]|nr:60S ribosomal protein [Venturia nashicola]